ncbi:LysR family transcriptional regulator [Nitrospirillum viridazoti]|uniref:LysR family transcriptional regulator n=2 Tax=Nitrospirillum TaxID=1543705 RepID=A0A560IHP8_9PROT|nr:LysR family transcriptional regulator [Nitrospirillum amazonense]TWB58547.1 LysR family transcriptional regulator [Nitrospirillum amazonense]
MQFCLGELMRVLEWSDLPIFLAIAREGTLGAAARKLGQTQPTMGRRLRALEEAVGAALFQRTSDGFVLTDEGQAMLGPALRMEEEALALQRQLAGSVGGLEGMLRVSCSDWFGVTMLSPVLAEFAGMHPAVVVEVLTDPRLYSLPRREADLVMRIRPFDEPEVIARRLVTISYGLYAKPGLWTPVAGDGAGCRLVLMDTAFGGMPDVGWVTRLLPKAAVVSRSNSREVQARLCALGAGLAVLPRPLGDSSPGIALVDLGEAPPSRDTWIGYHRDLRRLPRLRALVDLILQRLAN